MKIDKKPAKGIAIFLSDPWILAYIAMLKKSGGYKNNVEIIREALRWHSKIEIKLRAVL